MSYTITFPDSFQSGLAGTAVVGFYPIDDAKRAAVDAAMKPGGIRIESDPRNGGRPTSMGSGAVFSHFVQDGTSFRAAARGWGDAFGWLADEANVGPPPLRPAVSLRLGTLAQSFVGGVVFVDIGANNRWRRGFVTSDGASVLGAGGAPIPAAAMAAEIVEASKSGVAASRGSIRTLYEAGGFTTRAPRTLPLAPAPGQRLRFEPPALCRARVLVRSSITFAVEGG